MFNEEKERVCVDIYEYGNPHTLITSRAQADAFVKDWTENTNKDFLTIAGVLDHRDSNEIEYTLLREYIRGVAVRQIKRI